MCCPGEGCILLANVAQELSAIHFFLGLLLSTAALQFLPPKRALRVHGFRYYCCNDRLYAKKLKEHVAHTIRSENSRVAIVVLLGACWKERWMPELVL